VEHLCLNVDVTSQFNFMDWQYCREHTSGGRCDWASATPDRQWQHTAV